MAAAQLDWALTSYPTIEWCLPTIAHIAWDDKPVIRRVVKWADNVSRGKDDRRKSTTLARFVDGGTIGPAQPDRSGAARSVNST